MSILNIYLHEDTALIATDSLYRPMEVSTPEQDFSACKLYPVPCCNAIFSGRGERKLNMAIWLRLNELDRGSFDDLAEEFPHAIVWVWQELAKHCPGGYAEGERAIVGWSDKAGAMRCLYAQVGAEKMTLHDSYGATSLTMILTPGIADYLDQTDSPEAMFKAGKMQVIEARATRPDLSTGGDMLVATLTKDTMTLRNMGSLDDHR